MPTYENSYALVIPVVGSDDDVWGGFHNDNKLMYAAMQGKYASLEIDTVAGPNVSAYEATPASETLDWVLEDGVTDDGSQTFDAAARYPFIEFTSSVDLGATQIINVAGATTTTKIDRVVVIKNSIDGSQSIEIRNGEGANASPFLILNGQSKCVIIKSDGVPYMIDAYDSLNLVASDLTAIGEIRLDGSYPSTGSSNTAIGINALNTSATGTKNVAVGQNALTAIVGGDRNIAIGDNALGTSEEGQYNVAIGAQSMSGTGTTSAVSGNVCIGRQSGQVIVGADNTFVGYQSGKAATEAHGNVCVGWLAGTSITTGLNNTLIGVGAELTTGSSNILLGNASSHGIAAGANSVFAVGGTNSTYAIIGGDLSANSLTSTSDSNVDNFTITNKHASFTGTTLMLEADKINNADYNFIECVTDADDTRNTVYRVDGAGHSYADNGHTTGGADYAEMFEWADGNPSEEDREGRTVVMVDGKIVLSSTYYGNHPQRTDEIVGVISTAPSIVGNNPLNWPGMYKKDALGRKLDEVSDDYDDEQEYIPRSRRAEWGTVGLVGRIPMYKNQPIGVNWKKIRDVSDEAEEWLVR